MPGALAGLVVLEVANYVTGPYCGMLLGDLGAEVIKVEEPRAGDPFRGWGPGLWSPTFCAINRNKRSLSASLRTARGREIVGALARRADVLIQNFRPGVAERLGLGWETLHADAPRLVYCAISGFGQDGPDRDRPGYDTVGQARSGLLSLLTDLDAPKTMGVSLSDHLTALFACYGVLGALVARERTGEGQLVTTSLLEATLSFLGEGVARSWATGHAETRGDRARVAQVYAFVAGDALPFVIHLSSPPKFWEGLTEAIGRPELREDPRFRDRAARAEHYAALNATLAETFRQAPRAHWLAVLSARDVPCAPVETLDTVFDDPQVRHLGMAQTVEHPELGAMRVTRSGVQLGGTPVETRLPPPALGEHTAAILATLGYDAAAVEALRQEGVC